MDTIKIPDFVVDCCIQELTPESKQKLIKRNDIAYKTRQGVIGALATFGIIDVMSEKIQYLENNEHLILPLFFTCLIGPQLSKLHRRIKNKGAKHEGHQVYWTTGNQHLIKKDHGGFTGKVLEEVNYVEQDISQEG